jgi:polyisoprenoid-binding protein YceI
MMGRHLVVGAAALCVTLSSSNGALSSWDGAVSAASPPTAASFTIDPVHSSAVFRIKHLDTAWFYGRFNKVGGEIMLDEKGGSVNVEIDADSVDTNNPDRNTHLKSQDFLSVKEFPKLGFKSKTVTKKGDDWEVAGDFTLHGVTKPLTVTVKPTGSSNDPKMGARSGFETEFTIKRSDYGMTFMLDNKALGDEVKIMLSVEAVEKK